MKLAIMQPYAFPYLGYFQLMKAVDRFVLLDDVSFIKQGWINRNVLSNQQGAQRFSIPVKKPKMGQLISTVQLHDPLFYQQRLLVTIRHYYSRAPNYVDVFPVVEQAISYDSDNLADYVHHTIKVLNEYLGIETPLYRSSKRYEREDERGWKRVIKICQAEGADIYINSEGGAQLYDENIFHNVGIELVFLVHIPRPYRQYNGSFIPRLSIIDAMMFNSQEEMVRLLEDYRLAKGCEI